MGGARANKSRFEASRLAGFKSVSSLVRVSQGLFSRALRFWIIAVTEVKCSLSGVRVDFGSGFTFGTLGGITLSAAWTASRRLRRVRMAQRMQFTASTFSGAVNAFKQSCKLRVGGVW